MKLFSNMNRFKIKGFIEDWIYPAYRIRNRTIHHYNVVKTTLNPYQYHDIDLRMFECLRSLLIEFVEKEFTIRELIFLISSPNNEIDTLFYLNLSSLYYFYKSEYPKLEKSAVTVEEKELLYRKCTEIMKETIEIRHLLWT